MPETFTVKHDIDLGQLERFEKALKEFKDTGSVKQMTAELRKQLALEDKINNEKQEGVGIVGKLIAKQKELKREQKYATTEKELERINKKLRETAVNLRNAKNTTATWGKAIGSFQFKFNALGNIMANVTSRIAQGFNREMKKAITTVVEFESAMAGVRAISGATDKEFKRLEADAIRLGGATIFTARQVAELQINYAKLGFSTQEILNATEATLSLAAATDESLSASALVAGSTLRAFGLDATETQRVVDVMAKSFTSSALNLENFTEAMKFLAPVAKSAGFTIEETTAILGTLADTGLKGSLAGTSLRNIFLRLADPTSKLSKRLGQTVRTGDELVNALNKLKAEGIDLGEALELTNLRAVTAFSTLADKGGVVDQLTKKLNEATGSAQEMADIRMDTLKGSITILRSAWEGFILSAERGSGILTRGIRSAIDHVTELVVKMKELTLSQDEFAEDFGEFKGAEMMREFSKEIRLSEDKIGDITKEVERNGEALKVAQEELAKYGGEAFADQAIALAKFQEKNEDVARQMFFRMSTLEKASLRTRATLAGTTPFMLILTDAFEKQRIEVKKEVKALEEYEIQLRETMMLLQSAGTGGGEGGEIVTTPEEAFEEERVLFDSDKAEKEAKLLIKIRTDTAKALVDIGFEQAKRDIIQSQATEEEKTELLKELANERSVALLEIERDRLSAMMELAEGDEVNLIATQIELIEERIKSVGVEIEKQSTGESMWAKWGVHVRNSTDFILDSLNEINDNEKKIHEERINRYDTEISELQRSLDQQLQLQRDGKANRVTLVEQEIAENKRMRERALKEKEKAIKRERTLNTITQASNLAVASSEIFKEASKESGVWGWIIAAISVAGMIASFVAQLSSIDDAVYEEGGWVDGEPHSRGGKWINAEGDEFMVRKRSARKIRANYPGLLENLNDGDLDSAFRNLNMDHGSDAPIINFSNKKVEDKLDELIKLNREMPRDMGKEIWFYYGGTKYVVKK